MTLPAPDRRPSLWALLSAVSAVRPASSGSRTAARAAAAPSGSRREGEHARTEHDDHVTGLLGQALYHVEHLRPGLSGGPADVPESAATV